MPASTKRVTMKDIAAKAGVAQQSVSEVLNDSPRSRIKKETRDKILAAAAELGYRPNYLASSLKKGKTDVIGFIGAGTGEETRFTLPNMQSASSIEKALPDDKSMIMLSGRGEKGMAKSLNLVQRGIVDGLILKVYPFHYKHLTESIIPELNLTGIPYVVIHPTGRELPCAQVGINRTAAAYQAAKKMTESGITDIGVIQPGPRQEERDEVTNGVSQALAEAGAELRPDRILSNPAHIPGTEYVPPKNHLLEKMDKIPRGLVVFNSGAAQKATEVLAGRKVRVPEDVMVAGLGPLIDQDDEYGNILLTGVPIEEQSKAAADLILGLINGSVADEDGRVLLEPQLLHVPADI